MSTQKTVTFQKSLMKKGTIAAGYELIEQAYSKEKLGQFKEAKELFIDGIRKLLDGIKCL